MMLTGLPNCGCRDISTDGVMCVPKRMDTMKNGDLVIDADGHILEPPDLWERYLEPKYRDRALRIRVGDDGFEFLEIDGKRAQLTSAALLHSLGGMKMLREMGAKVEDFNADRRAALGKT